MPQIGVLLGWGGCALALTFLVSGCSDPVPYVADFRPGEDSPEEGQFPLGPMAESSSSEFVPGPSVAWAQDGAYLAVITFGSGSCPSGPTRVAVVGDQEIEIGLGALSEQTTCTADVSPHATVLDVPDGISSAEPLVAHIGGQEVTLPAA